MAKESYVALYSSSAIVKNLLWHSCSDTMLSILMVEAFRISILITFKIWSISALVNYGLSQQARALNIYRYVLDLRFTVGHQYNQYRTTQQKD